MNSLNLETLIDMLADCARFFSALLAMIPRTPRLDHRRVQSVQWMCARRIGAGSLANCIGKSFSKATKKFSKLLNQKANRMTGIAATISKYPKILVLHQF